jgi:hypothetical protein
MNVYKGGKQRRQKRCMRGRYWERDKTVFGGEEYDFLADIQATSVYIRTDLYIQTIKILGRK